MYIYNIYIKFQVNFVFISSFQCKVSSFVSVTFVLLEAVPL